METASGIMAKIIARNHQMPSKKFATCQDSQPDVLIRVFEGQRKFTKDNNSLNKFELTGAAQIEVTFNIDTNGILSIAEQDLTNTKSEKSIAVE